MKKKLKLYRDQLQKWRWSLEGRKQKKSKKGFLNVSDCIKDAIKAQNH